MKENTKKIKHTPVGQIIMEVASHFQLYGYHFNDNEANIRAETYRSRIHWVIFAYIWRMMMGKESQFENKPTADRIKRLEMDESLRLLAEELKMCVKRTTEFVYENRYKPNSTPGFKTYESWIVSDEYKYNDTILDTIEREHWQAFPDESFSSYLNKSKRWERNYCFF